MRDVACGRGLGTRGQAEEWCRRVCPLLLLALFCGRPADAGQSLGRSSGLRLIGSPVAGGQGLINGHSSDRKRFFWRLSPWPEASSRCRVYKVHSRVFVGEARRGSCRPRGLPPVVPALGDDSLHTWEGLSPVLSCDSREDEGPSSLGSRLPCFSHVV